MDTQFPMITEKPLPACGCRKFQIDTLDDHLCTCTDHSGVKKAHDWVVDQLTDLFHTTTKVKSQQVVKSRGHHYGNIELAGYLDTLITPTLIYNSFLYLSIFRFMINTLTHHTRNFSSIFMPV
jgi:hypothetical protein